MKKSDFVFDAALNTATISAEFARNARNVRSAEYRFLCNERHKNPTMTITVRTHTSGNRLTYKDMESRLRRMDQNGKLMEAFGLVVEISRTEKSPYAFVYNWFKKQVDAARAEEKSEKKAASSNSREVALKKLKELEGDFPFNASADDEFALEEDKTKEV